jgi:hypothetical protein
MALSKFTRRVVGASALFALVVIYAQAAAAGE